MRPVSRRNLQLFFGPPRAQGAAQAVTGQKQSFYCVFQVEVNEALNFSKDLQFSMEVWDFQDAEALHQEILEHGFFLDIHQQFLRAEHNQILYNFEFDTLLSYKYQYQYSVIGKR